MSKGFFYLIVNTEIMINKIKNIISVVVNFMTGLGFYGIGLLLAGIGVWVLFGYKLIGAGLIGAFTYKNYKALVDFVKAYVFK